MTVGAPIIVFWDLDGTLLTTARAGIPAWQDALLEVTGAALDLADFDTAGLLDTDIAKRLLEHTGHASDPPSIAAMSRAYVLALPARLPERQGHVHPNVREILAALRRRGTPQYLLTGNLRDGAIAKLRHYGLADAISDGAFADGAMDRADVARRALALAGAAHRNVVSERTYLVGDTPHDIACGAAIGARTIAVATGPYDVGELRRCSPWIAMPSLPSAPDFLALIDR